MGAKGISKRAPIGKRFGTLTVISPPMPRPGNTVAVTCRCACGDERDYFVGNLVKYYSPSCPTCRTEGRPAKGQSGRHPLFNIWKAMIQRCENPNHTFYAEYGGRGISICQRWRHDFLAFAADIGERPDQAMTIDRIDGDRGYEPGNVRWATQKTQMNNRRMNVRIEWRGRSFTLAEAAEEAGLEVATLTWRVKTGWDIERAMTTPSRMTTNLGVPKRRRAHA